MGKTYPNKTLAGNGLSNNIHGTLVDTLVGGLQADLDQIEGVSHDDGAEATSSAGAERAQLLNGLVHSLLLNGLDFILDLLGRGGRGRHFAIGVGGVGGGGR